MIPILFESSEKEFNHSGLGFLVDCISCKVTEERNGIFECEFVYPVIGSKYHLIQEKSIIYATHDESGIPQPFDIYARSAPIDGKVTFYAHHISYRLSNAVVMPFSAGSIQEAFEGIKDNLVTDTEDDFSFWTDKETTGDYQVKFPSLCRNVLGGSEGSILDRYGRGDYEFDKFDVKLYYNRGRDTDVEIRYGKNLINFEQKVDTGSSYNAIAPYWYDEETGDLQTIPEGYVYHDDGSPYVVAITRNYYNGGGEEEQKPTVAELRQKALTALESSKPWEPSESYTVNFAQLWETPEYERFASLQQVRLCDTVRVYYPEMGIEALKERVVKTVYNVLLDRYDEITLNETATTLSSMTQEQISASMGSAVTYEAMSTAIRLAIELVSGGAGGYIMVPTDSDGYPQMIYVMDRPSVAAATNVIRIGSDGISRSTNGIEGPWTNMLSMTGEITATGDVILKMSGSEMGRLVSLALNSENVAALKATRPIVLANGSGAIGYRYGGSAGAGSYGAIHYLKGSVVIDGDLTVTGTINNGGA